jgi:hypothetical protein
MSTRRDDSADHLIVVPICCNQDFCELWAECRPNAGARCVAPRGRRSKMSLSEAIRLGSSLDRQAGSMIFEEGASSATGAALVAAYGDSAVLYAASPISDTFPIAGVPAFCPVAGCRHSDRRRPACPLIAQQDDVGGICDHLEEAHGWTRWRVADWVQTIEAQTHSQFR